LRFGAVPAAVPVQQVRDRDAPRVPLRGPTLPAFAQVGAAAIVLPHDPLDAFAARSISDAKNALAARNTSLIRLPLSTVRSVKPRIPPPRAESPA